MLLALVFLLACGKPSAAKVDAAIADCRLRARASGSDYAAAFQVCLIDYAKLGRELAAQLGTAEDWHMRSMGEETLEQRWRDYAIYTSYLRLSRFKGADSAWIEKTIARDSSALATIP